MKLGEIIKNKRIELNMTQVQLAQTVGTTDATISRWESGDIKKIGCEKMNALADALHLDQQIFFQKEEVLMPEELEVIKAYRKAGIERQNSVRKLLDLPETKKDIGEMVI